MPCLTAGLIYAGVAQLVVQLIRNEQVAGSNPVTSLTKIPILRTLVKSGYFFVSNKIGLVHYLFTIKNVHQKRRTYDKARLYSEVGGKTYFAGKDIASALGYAETAKAIREHCKGVSEIDTPTNGGVQKMKYISEGDVYRLITHCGVHHRSYIHRICGYSAVLHL